MKNWFNETPHPTDSYIHWTEKNPTKKAAQLRKAWDKLAYHDEEALVFLLREAYHMGELDENDSHWEK